MLPNAHSWPGLLAGRSPALLCIPKFGSPLSSSPAGPHLYRDLLSRRFRSTPAPPRRSSAFLTARRHSLPGSPSRSSPNVAIAFPSSRCGPVRCVSFLSTPGHCNPAAPSHCFGLLCPPTISRPLRALICSSLQFVADLSASLRCLPAVPMICIPCRCDPVQAMACTSTHSWLSTGFPAYALDSRSIQSGQCHPFRCKARRSPPLTRLPLRPLRSPALG